MQNHNCLTSSWLASRGLELTERNQWDSRPNYVWRKKYADVNLGLKCRIYVSCHCEIILSNIGL